MPATASAPGSAPRQKRSASRVRASAPPAWGLVHTAHTSTAASGTRFGRVSTAAAVASPAPTRVRGEPLATSQAASAHQAAAGTSLMGCTTW